MTTFTNRNLDASTRFLPGEAYTGGVDADWRLGSKYAIRGFLAGSTVHGDPTAIDELQRNNVHSFQRPDSDNLTYDPTRTAMNGYGGSASVSKIAGARMVAFVLCSVLAGLARTPEQLITARAAMGDPQRNRERQQLSDDGIAW